MQNLKCGNNKKKYVFYYKLEDSEKALFKNPKTDLKIELGYTLGGVNYFSGNTNPRGYKFYFTPVQCLNTGMESYVLLGDQFESGYSVNVEGANRFSAKRLGELAEALDGKVVSMAKCYLAKDPQGIFPLVTILDGKSANVKALTKPKASEPLKSSQVVLTKEVKEKLPKLYSQDGKEPMETKVVVKFFDPTGSWTWYATEGEPTGEKIQEGAFKDEDDYKFFGYVKGFEGELGYFTLGELSTAKSLCKGLQALPIERDINFGFNKTLAEVMA